MILPSGSLVHQLHTAGIPCVFASSVSIDSVGLGYTGQGESFPQLEGV